MIQVATKGDGNERCNCRPMNGNDMRALGSEGTYLTLVVLSKNRHDLAPFSGSSCVRTKNRKERGEPGKIYLVRNFIGRENLITSGQMNELAHTSWTEHTRSAAKAL